MNSVSRFFLCFAFLNTSLVLDASSLSPTLLKASQSVVKINVIRETVSNGRIQKVTSSGSGFVISKDGYILTNYHVIGRPVRIRVFFEQNIEYDAVLVGSDPYMDISVIKVEPPDSKLAFLPVKIGDSARVKKGDVVYALGSPANLSEALTRGIVSNPSLNLPSSGYLPKVYGETIGSLVDWIAHDASIFGGNSGGPLLNESGEVIGINEIGIARLGGAIPIHLGLEIATRIIEFGHADRSWIGVNWQPVLSMNSDIRGVLVGGVYPDFNGEACGLQTGDYLCAINGDPVQVSSLEEMPSYLRRIYSCRPGTELQLSLKRGDQEFVKTLKTEPLYPSLEAWFEIKRMGLVVQNLNPVSNLSYRQNFSSGVRVIGCRKGFSASEAQPALKNGDVLLALDDFSVENIEDLNAWTSSQLESNERKQVLAKFNRNGQALISLMTIDPWEIQQPPPVAKRGWLGIQVQALTRDITRKMELSSAKAIRITEIYPDTKAFKSGLMVGDLILKVNGRYVKFRNSEDYDVLNELFRSYPPDSVVELVLIRDGEEQTVSVELESEPISASESARYSALELGITLRALVFDDRKSIAWRGPLTGVVVDHVEIAGWGHLANMSSGNILIAFDGKPVPDLETFIELYKQCVLLKKPMISSVSYNGISTTRIQIEPDWN